MIGEFLTPIVFVHGHGRNMEVAEGVEEDARDRISWPRMTRAVNPNTVGRSICKVNIVYIMSHDFTFYIVLTPLQCVRNETMCAVW